MIIGVGIDLVQISRFDKILTKWGERFPKKFYTPIEIDYSKFYKNASQYYASNFAVKEAFSKAIGTGFQNGMRFSQVEVLRTKLGKPYIVLYGKARELADDLGVSTIHSSISHDGSYAVANVILEG